MLTSSRKSLTNPKYPGRPSDNLTRTHSTNQTTLEHLSPFLLLRQLPKLPEVQTGRHNRLSDPPLEHELSYAQRRLIREAHGTIRQYDLGWKQNWAQVFGWDRSFGWVYRVALGGGG